MKPMKLAEDASFVSAAASARPIDLVHLSKYTLGNRDLENELMGLFRAQADVYLGRLAEAASDADWVSAAHSLKGSAKALGAWRLAELAEFAERGAAVSERPQALQQLKAAVAAVNAFIDGFHEA